MRGDWAESEVKQSPVPVYSRHRNIRLLMKRTCFTCLQVIKVWDLETGRSVFEFSQAHGDHAVTCMSFDSTERRWENIFPRIKTFFSVVCIICP